MPRPPNHEHRAPHESGGCNRREDHEEDDHEDDPVELGVTPTSHPHSPFEGKHDFYNVDSLLGSSEQVAFHNLRGPFDFPKEDEAHLDVAGKQSQVQAKKKVM